MKVSFVIPFHNEEKNAGPMLDQVLSYVKKQPWNAEIVPVDDRSTDRTWEVLKKYAKKYPLVKPVRRDSDEEELGNTMGKALLLGSKKSTGDIVIWTMGDRADDPNTYGAIVNKINQGFDMVFGSRYMAGGTRGSLDPIKAFLSSSGTVLARIMFGIKVHDITNAFRGFRRKLVDQIVLESSGFGISPEFAIKTHMSGFKLGEVPTVYYDRVEGVSNFKLGKMSAAYLKIFMKLFLNRYSGKSRNNSR